MELITDEQRERMLDNGRKTAQDLDGNCWPVVKLFTPDAGATWLLSELDPDDPDMAFGLCDLGLGFPELGYVLISDIERLRGPLGLAVERDLNFKPEKPILDYAKDARMAGRITA